MTYSDQYYEVIKYKWHNIDYMMVTVMFGIIQVSNIVLEDLFYDLNVNILYFH